MVEAADQPGGAVRTGEITVPGYAPRPVLDFYPLAARLRVIRGSSSSRRAAWAARPLVLAHPAAGRQLSGARRRRGDAGALAPRRRRRLARACSGCGTRRQEPFMERLPSRSRRCGQAPGSAPAGPADALRLRPLRRSAGCGAWPRSFGGAGGRLLLAGNALHADLTPERRAARCSAGCWSGSAQQRVPRARGRRRRLTARSCAGCEARGGAVCCGSRSSGSRSAAAAPPACAPPTATVAARRAVLADVGAPQLYLELLVARAPAGAPAAPDCGGSSTTTRRSRSTGR